MDRKTFFSGNIYLVYHENTEAIQSINIYSLEKTKTLRKKNNTLTTKDTLICLWVPSSLLFSEQVIVFSGGCVNSIPCLLLVFFLYYFIMNIFHFEMYSRNTDSCRFPMFKQGRHFFNHHLVYQYIQICLIHLKLLYNIPRYGAVIVFA